MMEIISRPMTMNIIRIGRCCMENFIICPCCGRKINIMVEDGKTAVFFVAQNQDELQSVLREKGVELALLEGGDNHG